LQADAKFPVIRTAYPFVAAKLLTDPSPRLQLALLAILRKGKGKSSAANLRQTAAILRQALASTDPLTLAERLASIYLAPEQAPFVRELMDQVIDLLDELSARAPDLVVSTAVATASAAAGVSAAAAPPAGADDADDAEAAEERRLTALAVESALQSLRDVLTELASGSPVVHTRAQVLVRTLLDRPMGQQYAGEFAAKLSERAAARTKGVLKDWPVIRPMGNDAAAASPAAAATSNPAASSAATAASSSAASPAAATPAASPPLAFIVSPATAQIAARAEAEARVKAEAEAAQIAARAEAEARVKAKAEAAQIAAKAEAEAREAEAEAAQIAAKEEEAAAVTSAAALTTAGSLGAPAGDVPPIVDEPGLDLGLDADEPLKATKVRYLNTVLLGQIFANVLRAKSSDSDPTTSDGDSTRGGGR
jgi:hypothetical protein